MKKTKRILALAGAALLAALYISTLIFALIDSPAAAGLLKTSVAATILIPVILYSFILVCRLARGKHSDGAEKPKEKKPEK